MCNYPESSLVDVSGNAIYPSNARIAPEAESLCSPCSADELKKMGWAGTVKVPTVADELRETALKVQRMSMAEVQASRALDHARELAKEGKTEFHEKVMTKEFFLANKEMLAIPEDKTAEDVAEECYASQRETYKIMEGWGFKVTYKDLDLPSTLDISMDARTRQIVEQTRRFTEAEVVVSWE